jgi:hypothetical protein
MKNVEATYRSENIAVLRSAARARCAFRRAAAGQARAGEADRTATTLDVIARFVVNERQQAR